MVGPSTDTLHAAFSVKGASMRKRILAFMLIASSLHCQTMPTKDSRKPCPDENVIPAGVGVTVVQRHDHLRRGREDQFAILSCFPQLPYGGCGTQPHPSQTGIIPVAFAIDSPPLLGLSMQYRDGHRYRTLVPGTPVRFHSGSKVLLLKMKAAADAPLGVQRLRGTLIFNRVEPGKVRSAEKMIVDFAVIIVDHNATVTEADWRFGNQVGRYMKDVALTPLVPFQFLLFVIVCSTSTCDV